MKRTSLKMLMAAMAMLVVLAGPCMALAADSITVTGEVNDSFQVVGSNGDVYEVADTTEGNDLVENHIGEKATVTGTLEVDQDVKILTVTKFQIIAE